MSTPREPLRLNVGFIVHAQIGYTRDFDFEVPHIRFAPDFELYNLTGTVRISRTPQGLPVQVRMSAILRVQCVRCLTDAEQTLSIDFTEMYAFTPRQATESDLILPEDMHIDLTSLVYEYMLLEVPISPLCKEECLGLCPICGANQNTTLCNHGEDEEDPRLAVLKSLLEEDEEDKPKS